MIVMVHRDGADDDDSYDGARDELCVCEVNIHLFVCTYTYTMFSNMYVLETETPNVDTWINSLKDVYVDTAMRTCKYIQISRHTQTYLFI